MVASRTDCARQIDLEMKPWYQLCGMICYYGKHYVSFYTDFTGTCEHHSFGEQS